MRDEATIGAHPALLRAWLDATPDGVIAVDASGRVLIHNRPASRVTGLTPPDAEGRPWREVLQLDGAVADALWAPSVANRSAEVVTEVLCAQGNRRTAELTSSPWREPGHGSGVLILIRDLAVLCRQRTAPAGRAGYGNLVGAHPAMQALYDMIELVAPSDAPVVIEGETGVGKELVAQLLHARSRRAERPLIAINCAALALGVLESELFGHVRGAFTGAVGSVTGCFALADTGTIFLDEISEAPVSTQVKLLRVLQSGEFERVGDPRPRRTDVRVIAASNRPLEDEVAARRFREDLYYRLKVVRITVPPLRERRTDIASLAEHFLAKYGAQGYRFSSGALAVLEPHAWPGNVRELENVIRRTVACLPAADRAKGMIGPEAIPLDIGEPAAKPPPHVGDGPDRRARLLRALTAHAGNRAATARALGIGRATLYRWLSELGVS